MHRSRPDIMRIIVPALMTLVMPALSLPVWAEQQGKGPVKVFILAGQSNMVGDGRIDPADTKGTLAYMVRKSDKKTSSSISLAKTANGCSAMMSGTFSVNSPVRAVAKSRASMWQVGSSLDFRKWVRT